ncbi:Sorbin and SH3 domain-containing protein 2 [Entophlyctis sp. JEL0112]|nr:Sorbin and SH3 domain-containing protein 2 [Entophlyctis sp. JEL0112]
MTTNTTAICVPLTGSTSCPDLASYSAYVGANLVAAGVSDRASLDSYVLQASADGSGDSFGVAMRSASLYDCPGWDGTGLRYQTTAVCVQLVWAGIGNTDTASPCNPTGTTLPICKTSMQRFINAWSKVFSNTAYCPSGQNDLAKTYSTDVAETENYLSTASGCIVAENTEVNNCGYNTLAEAQTFCASDISGDTCCSSISFTKVTTAAAAAATSTVAAAAASAAATAASSSTSSSSSSSGMSMQTIIYIAAGGGAAVLIIAVTAIYCCCFRKKAKPASLDDMYTSGVGGGDAMYMKNRGAPMGRSTPPKSSNTNLMAQKDTYVSKFNYTPQMPDELQTLAGDRIFVKHKYDDGWALGSNLRTGKEGQFPLDLLEGFDNPFQQQQQFQNIPKNAAGFNRRASSLYGPPAGMGNMPPQSQPQQQQPWNQPKGGPIVPLPGGPVNANKGPTGNSKSGNVRSVTMDFDPVQPDEMELRIGDTIQVKEEYDDGWAFGTNLITLQSGLFPLDCLDSSNVGKKNKNHSLRMSSLNGAPGAMPAASLPKQTDTYTVAEDFDPENPDEIELRVGDKVQVKKQYDDGWCTGLNLTTNQTGLLPLDCLAGFVSGPKPVTADGKKLQKQRVSSIYDADFAAPGAKSTPPAAAGGQASGDIFNVVEDFDPENPDEIELRVGDKVQVKKKYDDGWCTGLNMVTNQTGLLPLDCLAEFATGQQKPIKPDGKKLQKQRVSSIYDADFSAVNGSMAPSAGGNAASGQPDVFTVAEDFDPENPDEIELRVGDKVQVKKKYDDGWCTGLNMVTNQTGLLPIDCLAGFATGPKPVKPDGKKLQKQRMSSIYDADMSSYANNGPSGATKVTTNASDTYNVVEDFDAENPDEIELRVGDKVQVKKKYDDGWCTGLNLITNQTGLLPLDCLAGFSSGQQKPIKPDGKKLQKQRISSIYDADFSVYGGGNATPASNGGATTAVKAGETYLVAEDFDPENPDEIELRVGDKILVKKTYDDGWCTGQNMVTNQTGLLPVDCLAGFGAGPKPVKPDGKKLQKQRVSSIYDADFSVYTGNTAAANKPGPQPAAAKGVAGSSQDFYTVVEDFDPENPDEIELRVGDKIQVTKKYDDGWCTGLNTVTNQTGLLPLDCLAGFSSGQQKPVKPDGKKLQKQRVSSIYDADFSAYGGGGGNSAGAPAGAGKVIKAVYDFTPSQGDEIEVRAGDRIEVKKEFDDGWAEGKNYETNQSGLFPLDCLPGYGSGGGGKGGNRTSSMYRY